MRRIRVGRSAAEDNDAVAARNRARFARHGVCVLNLIGSPGCGKTSLIEHTARHFTGRLAAIIGDVKTTLDADRVAACGVEARGIETGGGCHLTATQVEDALSDLDLDALDLLFIENVGNLVCPSVFDLGEHMKVAVLSVPEGDEKVRKYPALFVRAGALVITKLDLIEHCPFDLERVEDDARRARSDVRIFRVSARLGTGFEPWLEFLREACAGRERS